MHCAGVYIALRHAVCASINSICMYEDSECLADMLIRQNEALWTLEEKRESLLHRMLRQGSRYLITTQMILHVILHSGYTVGSRRRIEKFNAIVLN